MALATVESFEAIQLDVKTAFLNGKVDEFEIYPKQPPRFERATEEDKVLLTKKSIYGPKQTPRR